MPLSNSNLGNISISLPPNIASTVILEPINGIAAGNVQSGIAELARQKASVVANLSDLEDKAAARENLSVARSGVNKDIVALGTVSQPFLINGILNTPSTSGFEAYASMDLSLPVGGGVIKYQATTFDNLGEYQDGRFSPQHNGIYFLAARVDLQTADRSNGLRTISVFTQNGFEHSRGSDLTVEVSYGGNFASTIAKLAAGDYMEFFCYGDKAFRVIGGLSLSFFKVLKIA